MKSYKKVALACCLLMISGSAMAIPEHVKINPSACIFKLFGLVTVATASAFWVEPIIPENYKLLVRFARSPLTRGWVAGSAISAGLFVELMGTPPVIKK